MHNMKENKTKNSPSYKGGVDSIFDVYRNGRRGGYFLLLLPIVLLTSCSSKTFDTEEALWEYVKDKNNGYIHHKTVKGVAYSLMYRPTDVLVNQELSDKYNNRIVDSLRKKYKEYMYFNLSMSKNNKELLSNVAGNKNQFGSMVNELAFGMEQKVHVYTPKKDTLAMLDFIYPRMYGMSNATTIMFVYPRDEKYLKDEYINLTVQDLGFYTGDVTFKIPTEALKNEPELKFEVK